MQTPSARRCPPPTITAPRARPARRHRSPPSGRRRRRSRGDARGSSTSCRPNRGGAGSSPSASRPTRCSTASATRQIPRAASRWSRCRRSTTASCGRSPSARTSRPATRSPRPRSRSTIASTARASATLLLERLAAIAARARLRAVRGDDARRQPRDARGVPRLGFEIRSKSERGCVERAAVADAVGAKASRRRAARPRSRPPRRCGRCFEPRAVAVVGASRDPGSIGRRILDALVAGRLHRAGLSGQPARRRTRRPAAAIASVARRCRAASISPIIAVPRRRVLAVVDDCAAAGVKSLVVITAGFAEIGDDGRALQQQLVEHGPRLRHADGRPQLHGAAQRRPGASG